MRKLFRTFLFAAFAVLTVSATDLTAQAAETTTEVTQTTKVTLTDASKAALKTVFDAKYYAQAYPDVVAALGNSEEALFSHYIANGINEGRDASATFNASVYALANPDIVAAYGDDINGYINHYVNFGVKENRIASTTALATADVNTQKAFITAMNSAKSMSTGSANVSGSAVSYVPSFADSIRPSADTIVTNYATGETHKIGDTYSTKPGWTTEITSNGTTFSTFNAREYDAATGSNTIDRLQSQEGCTAVYIDGNTGYSVTITSDSITDSNGNSLSKEEAYNIVT